MRNSKIMIRVLYVTSLYGKKCNDCKSYKKSIFDKKEKCMLFANLNMKTGNIEYNSIKFERSEYGNCKKEGIFWEEKNDLWIKQLIKSIK